MHHGLHIQTGQPKLPACKPAYMQSMLSNEGAATPPHSLQVYAKTVQPLVPTLFYNGKATCFAYGQTGSGKTYTMSPLPIRAADDILAVLARPEYGDVHLYVSCFEIYGNKVRTRVWGWGPAAGGPPGMKHQT